MNNFSFLFSWIKDSVITFLFSVLLVPSFYSSILSVHPSNILFIYLSIFLSVFVSLANLILHIYRTRRRRFCIDWRSGVSINTCKRSRSHFGPALSFTLKDPCNNSFHKIFNFLQGDVMRSLFIGFILKICLR